MDKSKCCCFTGHRVLKITDDLIDRLNDTLTELIGNGVTDFYAGGAIGWDMLCEQEVLRLRERFPQIRLHLVLPCPPDVQTAKWNIKQKAEYQRILTAADEVEILSETYYDGCMQKRNARLVELADCCFCYWNTNRKRSGTAQTVRMAQKKCIDVINFFMEDTKNPPYEKGDR